MGSGGADQGREASAPMARRLGTTDAVTIGLGAMLGAGVFASFAPAAAAAGAGLLIGLGVAAVVAYCNATSSAALAARYPTSGGSYVYGRERLGQWPGFIAGWAFVAGKSASCASMALTFSYYVAPAHPEVMAVLAVLGLSAVNYFGISRTAGLTRVLLVATLVVLAAMIVAVPAGGAVDLARLGAPDAWTGHGVSGILQAAGLLFFAFAGYARIATLGEEVLAPERTIPRAIPIALAVALAIYVSVGVVLLTGLDTAALAASRAPLADAVEAGTLDWLSPAARVGAAVASLGALLALIAGVGRTILAMARNSDLPSRLSTVHPRHRTPHVAEVTVAAVVSVLVFLLDLRTAIGLSSFCVLIYYAIANLSAATLPRGNRRVQRWVAGLGLLGCATLAGTLPGRAVLIGLIVLAAGLAVRGVVAAYRPRATGE